MKYSCGIYKIQSLLKPNRCYIGSSSKIENRWIRHLLSLRKNRHHSIKLQRHYNKYGISDLQFSILLGCDKDKLIEIEQYFLDSHYTYFNTCQFAGKGRRGLIPWNKNKKGVQIAWNKGLKMPEEQRLRMLCHPVSIETIEKIKLKKIGIKYKTSDAMLKKYKSFCKPILKFDLNIIFIKRYNSLKEASEETNISYQNLSSCLRGKSKTSGGYIWKYEN
jgi:group I intron endonuclease